MKKIAIKSIAKRSAKTPSKATRTPNQQTSITGRSYHIKSNTSLNQRRSKMQKIPSLQPPHQIRSHPRIDHSAHTKSRNNPRHPSKRTLQPVLSYFDHSLSCTHLAISVVEIQSQQMQRRRNQLDGSRSHELRRRCCRNVFLHVIRQRHEWCDQGRYVEGSEYCETVSECE